MTLHNDTTATRPAIAAGTYAIDPARSTARFAIKELWGLMTVRGTFEVTGGAITVGAEPAGSAVRASLDPASFASGNKRRDKDITGPRFLDAAAYPLMEFVSNGIGPDGGGWAVHGRLTVHGTTAPVTLRLTDGRQTRDGCAFTATAVVDRTAFGVSRVVGFIGRQLDVTIEIAATAVR
jgi:polyisoprenoid-binding protein YceI